MLKSHQVKLKMQLLRFFSIDISRVEALNVENFVNRQLHYICTFLYNLNVIVPM